MALSGVRDQAETVSDLVSGALQKIKVLRSGETADADDSALVLTDLRRMLRTWATRGIRLWLTEEQVVTLAADTATYTLNPRTLEIRYAYRRSGNNDTPIQIFDREEYMRLPNKSVSGAPYALWHDRQYNQTQIKVYPVPNAVGDTLRLTTKRQIQDVTALGENVELPPEWSEAIVYNLAVRIAPAFSAERELGNPRDPTSVAGMAIDLYEMMSAQDRGHSVHMGPRRW